MKNILIISGVNLNMLGIREPDLYGKLTYEELVSTTQKYALSIGLEPVFFQSNHEGSIVEAIQGAYGKMDAIIINAGAYTHTSVAILDALKAVNLPTVEVHLTDITSRESFRQFSYISLYAQKMICGKGINGYLEALDYLKNK